MGGINLTLDKGDKVLMEVDDVKGPGCKDIVQAVAEAVGAKIVREDPKDDFYASASTDATQSEGT